MRETGRSTPDVPSVMKLGKLYDMSLDRLLSGEEVLQQFQDLAQRQRAFWQMMLEIGIILQLLGALLRGLELPVVGEVSMVAGFLLLTVSILMHLRVFSHSRREILCGVAGIGGDWLVVLVTWLLGAELPATAAMVLRFGQFLTSVLLWSAGVWTMDWKSTRLWLIVALMVATPLLPLGVELVENGTLVKDNPFLETYRVEEVLYPVGAEEGQNALVRLSSKTMSIAMDGQDYRYIGRYQYVEPNQEDTERGIWVLTPKDSPEERYRLTVEADGSVLLAYSREDQLQWKWKLRPDQMEGTVTTINQNGNNNSFLHMKWYPNAVAAEVELHPVHSNSKNILGVGEATIEIGGSNGAPLELYETYHYPGGVEHHTYPLTADKRGKYKVELQTRHGDTEDQYAIYCIPYQDGEFQFLLLFGTE